MLETATIIAFSKGWLSNFYPSPFEAEGTAYRQVEQYFMYQKARFFGDDVSMQRILDAVTPREARELGQRVTPFDARWDAVRYGVMLQGSLLKYQQNASLREQLLATGCKILVEATAVDPIWGIAMSTEDPDILNPSAWRGKNLLGLCLMEVRARLSTAAPRAF